MSEKPDGKTTSRRDFLKLASTSVPAAAAAIVVAPDAADASVAETDGDGLRDTAHTRAYFESTRF